MLENERKGESKILALYDVKKHFDKESAIDCQYETYKNKVHGKLYRLIYLLNENLRIKVRTPVGLTDSAEIGPTVGQGTNSGSILSAVSMDGGISEYFPLKNEEESDEKEPRDDENPRNERKEIVKYASIEMNPMLFMDDINAVSNTIEGAQETNDKIEAMMESKLLDLHETKSKFIVIGKKKDVKKMKLDLETHPIKLYGNKMTEGKAEKYLGFYLAATAADSVTATIDKRNGLATKAIYEARAVVEDSRSEAIGGLTVMFDIFNLAICPMLYYCSEMFFPLPSKTLKKLNKFTITYLRVALGLGKRGGCPLVSLFWHTGTYLPINKILYHKSMFVHHIANLDGSSLARQKPPSPTFSGT